LSVGEAAGLLSRRSRGEEAAVPGTPTAKPAALKEAPPPRVRETILGLEDEGPDDEPEGDDADSVESSPGDEDTVETEVPDGAEAPDAEGVLATDKTELAIRALPPERLNETFVLRADGQTLEVPMRELLRGYARKVDYTSKTQALAQEREVVGVERQQYQTMLIHLGQRIQADLNAQREQMEAVRDTDPIRYLQLKDMAQEQQRQFEVARQEYNRTREAEQRQMQGQFQQHIDGEVERLIEVIPQLSKPDARAKFAKALVEGLGREYGLTENDVTSVNNHRALLIFHDALRYRQMAKKGQAARSKAVVPKLVSPATPGHSRTPVGTTDSKAVKAATTDLRESGSVRSAAALIAARSRQRARSG
jgi:hypothetical protein